MLTSGEEGGVVKKKSSLTPLQRVLDGVSILLCLAAVGYLIAVYSSLPAQIPSHYDAKGNITDYNGKSMLIVLAFLMVFIITLPMCVLARIRGLYKVTNTPFRIPKGQEESLGELTRTLLCAMNAVLTAMFAYILFCSARCENMTGFGIWLPMILLFVLLVWYCVRSWQLSKQPKEWEPWDD